MIKRFLRRADLRLHKLSIALQIALGAQGRKHDFYCILPLAFKKLSLARNRKLNTVGQRALFIAAKSPCKQEARKFLGRLGAKQDII